MDSWAGGGGGCLQVARQHRTSQGLDPVLKGAFEEHGNKDAYVSLGLYPTLAIQSQCSQAAESIKKETEREGEGGEGASKREMERVAVSGLFSTASSFDWVDR